MAPRQEHQRDAVDGDRRGVQHPPARCQQPGREVHPPQIVRPPQTDHVPRGRHQPRHLLPRIDLHHHRRRPRPVARRHPQHAVIDTHDRQAATPVRQLKDQPTVEQAATVLDFRTARLDFEGPLSHRSQGSNGASGNQHAQHGSEHVRRRRLDTQPNTVQLGNTMAVLRGPRRHRGAIARRDANNHGTCPSQPEQVRAARPPRARSSGRVRPGQVFQGRRSTLPSGFAGGRSRQGGCVLISARRCRRGPTRRDAGPGGRWSGRAGQSPVCRWPPTSDRRFRPRATTVADRSGGPRRSRHP